MRIFEVARHPPRWLRALLVGLVLAVGCGSLAHVTHTHGDEFNARSVDAALCGLCVAFDRVVDGPRGISFAALAPAGILLEPAPLTVSPSPRATFRLVPRGPPSA